MKQAHTDINSRYKSLMKQAHTDRKSRYKSLMKQAHTDRNSRHKSLMNFFCTRQTRQTRQTRHTLGTLAVSMSLWEVQLQWKKYHTWKRKQLDIRAKWTFYVITLRITITMTFFLMACGWYNAKYSCWVNIETQFCKMMLYSSHNNERETALSVKSGDLITSSQNTEIDRLRMISDQCFYVCILSLCLHRLPDLSRTPFRKLLCLR